MPDLVNNDSDVGQFALHVRGEQICFEAGRLADERLLGRVSYTQQELDLIVLLLIVVLHLSVSRIVSLVVLFLVNIDGETHRQYRLRQLSA